MPTPSPSPIEATVVAVSVGATGELAGGRRPIPSAFIKGPVTGRVSLGPFGLLGDEHVYEDHGGPDMALLAYPREHYNHWRSLGLDLPAAAAMGENLTTEGLLETDVHLGDIFGLGSAVVQACQTRSPCFKLAARFGRKDMAVMMQDTGYTGYLLRVLIPGEIEAGDTMTLLGRDDDHEVSINEAGQIMNINRNDLIGAQRLLAIPALGSSTRRMMATRVHKGLANPTGLHVERLFEPDDHVDS
jgi:MOSC domain-containing protein YiiM